MFVLKKILGAFLTPPGLFVTLLAAAAVYALVRRRASRKLWVFLAGLAVLIWALSTAPVADILTRALERGVPAARDPRGDVIIVLNGAGQRLSPGILLQTRLKVPILLCGFNYLDRNPIDQERLLAGLEESGVPRGQVILETRSRDTLENIRAAKRLCVERGFRSPLIITSAFHARRVKLTCRKLDFAAVLVPVSYSALGRTPRYTWRDFLPLADSLYNTSLAFNEYLGIIFYGIVY